MCFAKDSNLSSKEVVATKNVQVSGFANFGDKVYISSKVSHQVFENNGSVILDLGLNPEIMPTLFSAENFIHIKLISAIIKAY